ncbi:putative phytosulfokines 6 [Populus alba]|uniref:Phytosulfokine n=2 Tax=Populus TaxID=3689 RepID=A0A4U5NJF9_POPAL|nr:putative phytosulfokines 6 isoform X1 [Populus alba]KAJ7001658.1 phytosulfokines 6 isoform X1 [Populus alba x Populus x berolinensis]TKR83339.1 putative phytosulfokines 6 [Populus alba]
MKQTLHYKALLLFLLVLVHSSELSARFLLSKQGKEDLNLKEITSEGTFVETEGSELITNQLMGLEVCHSGDEECFKRRIIAEAHLDYIYTQHHKP